MITQFGTSKFGQLSYGGGDAKVLSAITGLLIAVVGDTSSHGGTITASNQDGKAKCAGIEIAVSGASHSCPIPTHGTTTITPIVIKSKINGKLIVTYGAMAGCGAIILPKNRKVVVEK